MLHAVTNFPFVTLHEYLLANFLCQVRVKCENPETEGQLILDLETNLTSKDRNQPKIQRNKRIIETSLTY